MSLLWSNTDGMFPWLFWIVLCVISVCVLLPAQSPMRRTESPACCTLWLLIMIHGISSHSVFRGKRQIRDAFYIYTFQSGCDLSVISDIQAWLCNLCAASTNCLTGDQRRVFPFLADKTRRDRAFSDLL